MRILIAALAVAASSAMADLVMSQGTNELRLLQEPCTNDAVLSQLKEEYRPQFKRAVATIGPQRVAGCWIDTHEGAYWIAFENGQELAFPISGFEEQPGV